MQVCSILMMLLNNPMSDSVVEYVAVGELLRAAFYHITFFPPRSHLSDEYFQMVR